MVLETTAEDVPEPVHESSVEEPLQEPRTAETYLETLRPEATEAESASETVLEDSTLKPAPEACSSQPVLSDPAPEPPVEEAVPEPLVSESSVTEPCEEEVTPAATVTEAPDTGESSAEERPAPGVESGKPDTPAWRPGDVFVRTDEGPGLILHLKLELWLIISPLLRRIKTNRTSG